MATKARQSAKSGNRNGDPINLHSKILHIIADPFSSQCIYVAESSGCVRKVNIKTKEKLNVYRGPTAPITSVAIGSIDNSVVFGASWDKSIWSWDLETCAISKIYNGHSDFVKTITIARLGGRDILISGGADKKIVVWDTVTKTRLYTLRDIGDTMLSLQDFAIDPYDSNETQIILFSASSDPFIRKWCLESSKGTQISASAASINSTTKDHVKSSIHEHETSVYKVLFADYDEDSNLWTSSADGTAKCLSRSANWACEETYVHQDYVCAVEVNQDFVITAGRDEDVKIWNRNTGTLHHIYEGHFDEVSDLVLIDGGTKVVSASIDGTIRCWELRKDEIKKAIKNKEDGSMGRCNDKKDLESKIRLSAEETAELAELMKDDDL